MILLFAAVVAAQGAKTCDIPGTDTEVAQCLWSEFKRADADLNRQYLKLLKDAEKADREERQRRLKFDDRPSDAETLRSAERACIQFRDLQCTMEGYSERGGTIAQVIENECFLRITRERTEQLRMTWQRG